MRTKIIFTLIIMFGFTNIIMAQVPHDINVPSNGSAERVARFKVQDDSNDFLEITNATQHSGKFIPKIWGHQQSDNRFVLDFFASTKSVYDNGTIPLMTFRAELRDALNLNAPNGGTFPWGTSGSNVVNRPLFGWYNGLNTQLMTLAANGNFGLGITSPTARLHTNGTVRFQNLPNATNPTYFLGTDSSGNVKEYSASSIGGSSDSDWFKVGGGTPSSISDNIYSLGNVGVNTTSPTANLHSNGTVRFEGLPNAKNPTYILGTDVNGNVSEYIANLGGVTLEPCLPTSTNFLTKVTSIGNLTCSQVYDDGLRVGIGTRTPAYKLSVNGTVHSMANIFISDKKFKKNISEIESPLETILKLNGKKYDWRVNEFKEYNFTEKKQIGFIAQEVKEIIPEIVHVDEQGEHSMNYTAIIPLLVEAVKEQQNQIVLLQNKLSETKSNLYNEDIVLNEKTSFSTNFPNPFSITTTIEYNILKSVNDAKIIIYDSNGTSIKTYELKERNKKAQITISKEGLKSGIYFYTMITDDIVIGTKKMIVK